MQRRLVKCLEDLASNCDRTIRTSTGEIVHFIFGEEGLDPACTEAKSGAVVDFEHVLEHTRKPLIILGADKFTFIKDGLKFNSTNFCFFFQNPVRCKIFTKIAFKKSSKDHTFLYTRICIDLEK